MSRRLSYAIAVELLMPKVIQYFTVRFMHPSKYANRECVRRSLLNLYII